MLRRKYREVHNIFCSIQKITEHSKIIIYKIKILHSARSVPSSVSSVADNLVKDSLKTNAKNAMQCIKYMTDNNGLLLFKCLDWNKNYEKYFNEDLVKVFDST